jgi:hypothetical protein
MGVELVYKNNSFAIYVDEYCEENTILKGHKQDSDQEWFVVSPKVAKILRDKFLREERKKKLENLKNVQL